jgi:hypothetical protein
MRDQRGQQTLSQSHVKTPKPNSKKAHWHALRCCQCQIGENQHGNADTQKRVPVHAIRKPACGIGGEGVHGIHDDERQRYRMD